MKIESPNESPTRIIEIFKSRRIYDLLIKECAKKVEFKCELVIN